MMKDIVELIFIHIVYIIMLGLIIVATARLKRKGIFYWAIAGLYVLMLIWLIYEYVGLGAKPDPGGFFAWEMLAMIIPGLLILVALIVFIISRIVARER